VTISGSLAGLTTTVNAISGSLSTLTNTVNTLSGALATTNANIATATGNIATLSGSLATTNTNLTTLSGAVATISTSVSTLSGQVASLLGASHAAVTLGTANGLSLSGQQISLALASGTTTGALSLTDWNTFNSKENVLIFGTGITRIGNSIGLTPGSAGQVLTMVG
jgi:trimeric autotransporter adhesin